MLKDNQVLETICFGVKKGQKYPEKVRQFCLSLQYHSTSAYKYIRKVFNNSLPHVKTMQQWYANSDANAEEGINDAHLKKLEMIVSEHKAKNRNTDLLCALIFDEMNIRQQILWNRQKSDYDGFVGGENATVAKQVIVFMLTGINYCLEFPVAYWVIDTLDKKQRKELLLKVIDAVSKTGIKIKLTTFDGYSSNIPMCELLGANLEIRSPSFQTFFNNPYNDEKIYIFVDPCHTVKLVRNTLGNKGTLYNGKGERIEWKFFESLIEYSRSNNFQIHKMSKKHLQWKRNIMNVRLAVETMSSSVAQAMEFLENAGHSSFIGAGPTIEFTRIMNTLFDIFNSKNMLSINVYKRALNPQNKRIVFDFLHTSVNYLQSLKIKQTNKAGKSKIIAIIHSRNHTGFRGFIINMHSLMQFYIENVEEKNALVMVPSYQFLQDSVEMFFGRIRASNGFNNNPNVQQFKGAYRKLSCNIKIAAPDHGNCRIFDNILPESQLYSDVFSVTSRRTKVTFESIQENYILQKERILEDVVKMHELKVSDPLLDAASDYSIAFLASRIEDYLVSMDFECENCAKIFDDNEKLQEFASHSYFRSPCRSTYKICKNVDKFLHLYDKRMSIENYDFQVIYCLMFRTIDFNAMFDSSKFDCDINHKYQIIKWIIKKYIDKKLAFISKEITLDKYDKLFRQQLNKLVLFTGQ